MKRQIAIALVATTLTLAACGSEAADPAPSQSEATPTVGFADLHLSDMQFPNLEEMAVFSGLIVVATQVESRPGAIRTPGGAETGAIQNVELVLEIEDVLKGSIDSKQVIVEWDGWTIETVQPDGTATETRKEIRVNGLEHPSDGETAVWFLLPKTGDRSDPPYFEWVSLDGRLPIADDKIVAAESHEMDHRLSARLDGLSLDDLKSQIAATIDQ